MSWSRLARKLKNLLPGQKRPGQVDVLTGYALWASHYPAKAHNPLMEIEQQAMLSLLPDLTGKVCLDLACGSGRYLLLLQAGGAAQVFGLDYSAEMLAQARVTDPGFKLVRSPFLPLPFPAETFDLMTCGLAVGHEKNLKRLLAEAARLLRVGGLFIYSDFHPFGTLAGWQRAFTAANGTVVNLEHYLHLYSDHQRACHAAGLAIDAVLEPLAEAHTPPQFREFPVVLVMRAVKTGSGGGGEMQRSRGALGFSGRP